LERIRRGARDLKRYLSVALGILTAIGGYVDVGAIVTAGQAGSKFGFGLLWAMVLGTICIIFLVEMVGRMGAMGNKAYADILREKFGIKFVLLPLASELIANFLLLAAEIGGAAFAIYLITGVSFQLWTVVVALVLWVLLWRGNFSIIENGTSILGLVALCFLVAAFKLGTPWGRAAEEIVLPSISGSTTEYFNIAASILGAIISPYLLFFYSSGSEEEGWTRRMIRSNRVIAVVGMGFGSITAIAIILVSAMALQPLGIQVEQLQTVGLGLVEAFGALGMYLFAATLFITCFGAATEIALALSYEVTQIMGWRYGEDRKPSNAPIFNLIFPLYIIGSTLLMGLSGIDPVQLTVYATIFTALILPVVVVPFLAVMNDPRYLKDQTNHWFANTAVLLIIVLAFILSITSVPLTIITGG
jgi:Mn2+/Fe2+ NRAMP family transporter